MKSNPIALCFILLLALQARGQGVPSSVVAKVFDSLGVTKVLNEVFIRDATNPSVVVLSEVPSGKSITLVSMAKGQVRIVWSLPQIPQFMSVIDPGNLSVTIADGGPIVSLHGCAAHLCGGKGVAGALAYAVNEHQLYTAYASYNSSTSTTTFVYSPENFTPKNEVQKKLLDGMLREEGYSP